MRQIEIQAIFQLGSFPNYEGSTALTLVIPDSPCGRAMAAQALAAINGWQRTAITESPPPEIDAIPQDLRLVDGCLRSANPPTDWQRIA